MVERDRTEWQRPWVAPEPAALDTIETGSLDTAEEVGRIVTSVPAEPEAVDVPPAALDADTTALPLPLPPPSTWDASHAGPGSPYGSVRPPDTTGTVDAPPPRRGRGGFFTAMVGALVGAVIGTGATLALVGTGNSPASGPVVAPTIDIPDGEFVNVVPAVARAVTPSVVRINILGSGAGGAEEELGLGSGVIYTSDGYIITNNHVVEGASGLRVKLASGETYRAEVVGTDPLNDLAVLKIAVDGLPAVNLRLDSDPVVGELAIAIGSPFGLDASVTSGVISAVGRDITVPDETRGALVIPAVIQTDAAINPGNSGGALVDQEGRLLGINTAILSATGGSQGVGFAIPVAQAVASADQLIESGVVRHAFLGVSGTDVTPEMAQRFGLDGDDGAVIESVEPDSGAADAGLQPEDIVIAVEGDAITSMSDLVVAIRRFQPGDTITITYLREGQRREADVTLGERPDGS